ncbi:hypothetical protein [Nonomuraea sp. NPDC023979]|uniref:hypothetical protein n=1 Tax=Nonomuraea sp. NPDC023979 TaxID=3154796 RepID=UPI00340A2B8C
MPSTIPPRPGPRVSTRSPEPKTPEVLTTSPDAVRRVRLRRSGGRRQAGPYPHERLAEVILTTLAACRR